MQNHRAFRPSSLRQSYTDIKVFLAAVKETEKTANVLPQAFMNIEPVMEILVEGRSPEEEAAIESISQQASVLIKNIKTEIKNFESKQQDVFSCKISKDDFQACFNQYDQFIHSNLSELQAFSDRLKQQYKIDDNQQSWIIVFIKRLNAIIEQLERTKKIFNPQPKSEPTHSSQPAGDLIKSKFKRTRDGDNKKPLVAKENKKLKRSPSTIFVPLKDEVIYQVDETHESKHIKPKNRSLKRL